jgi:hypothetical protein
MAVLEQLIGELNIRERAVEMQTSIKQGNPAKVLIDRSKGIDLIVVGSGCFSVQSANMS